MRQNFKVTLQAFVIMLAIGTAILWAWPRPDLIVWALRFAVPMLALACCWILIRNALRKEIFPDKLFAETSEYFEQEGFCFNFVPIVIGGISWMQIYFQNRFARPCSARVVLQPPREYFLGQQVPFARIDVNIACEAAAFGVCRIPWPIPERLQGKKTKFEVAANVTYPSGRGKLVRFRQGLSVGTPGGGASRAAATAGWLLIGAISISRAARITLTLPAQCGHVAPPSAEVWSEILQRPDLTILESRGPQKASSPR